MKNLFKYFILSIIIVLSYGCEEDIVDNIGGQFIQLADAADISVAENSPDSIVLEVILGEPQNSDVTVNFEITGDLSRYSASPTSGLVIPQGETSGNIEITLIDNFDTDGNEVIVLSLLSSSDLPVGIGGTANAVSKTITIVDDDCPITIGDWVGTYDVTEVITGGPNEGLALADAFGEVYIVDMALDPTDTTGTRLVLTNLADTYLADGTVLTFLTCEGAVSIEPAVQNVALFTTFSIDTSSYNEGNFSITADGPLGTTRTYQMVFTKQ